LATDWDLELALSFDLFDIERIHRVPAITAQTLSYHEEKVMARAIARWTPDTSHKLALAACRASKLAKFLPVGAHVRTGA